METGIFDWFWNVVGCCTFKSFLNLLLSVLPVRCQVDTGEKLDMDPQTLVSGLDVILNFIFKEEIPKC